MKHLFYTLVFISISLLGNSQSTTLTFEDANLEVNQYLNGGDLPLDDNFFYFEDVSFQSNYDTAFQYWTSGWAVSTVQDSTTNGFSNLYGAYPFAGADGSLTFMVGQYSAVIEFPDSLGTTVNSVDITNASFPLLVMRDGDPSGFSKQFGGADGNDPDFFVLDIEGRDINGDSIGVVSFYLADYRFDDNALDYIINEWTSVDLSSLGTVKSLEFSLRSSDENQWGILTPAFYCIDNLNFGIPTNTADLAFGSVSIAPNPTQGELYIDLDEHDGAKISIFDLTGRLMHTQSTVEEITVLNLEGYKKGCYLLNIESEGKVYTEKVILH